MEILKALAFQCPLLLILLAGILVVTMRWSSLRAGALPALAGLTVALLSSIIFPVLWATLPRRLVENGNTQEHLAQVFAVLNVIHSLCWAGSLGLLIAGVCLGRSPNRAESL